MSLNGLVRDYRAMEEQFYRLAALETDKQNEESEEDDDWPSQPANDRRRTSSILPVSCLHSGSLYRSTV